MYVKYIAILQQKIDMLTRLEVVSNVYETGGGF
jgi:hypothetical protein